MTSFRTEFQPQVQLTRGVQGSKGKCARGGASCRKAGKRSGRGCSKDSSGVTGWGWGAGDRNNGQGRTCTPLDWGLPGSSLIYSFVNIPVGNKKPILCWL